MYVCYMLYIAVNMWNIIFRKQIVVKLFQFLHTLLALLKSIDSIELKNTHYTIYVAEQ